MADALSPGHAQIRRMWASTKLVRLRRTMYPEVATTVKVDAKAFAIPGNKTMEEESETGLPIFYILNPIYHSGCRLNLPGEEGPGPGPGPGTARRV
ncbi:hypothetical protein Trihar35433_842 [Trichoderma harzianum]|nr:hypothetical protein Trihar35433_842 [Trichoderma harzianum]